MSADQFDLSHKVAIVVGATKGIGEAIAEEFAASGARLLIVSRTAADVTAMVGDLNQRYEGSGNSGKVAAGFAGDMTDPVALQAMVATALEQFGTLTTLVLSPTIAPWFGPSIETPDDEIDAQFLYVFKSRFWLTRLCIPHLVAAGGGSVVNIGSGSSLEATSERSVYSCMRAAEVQMVKNFAAEFGPDNVRFNLIAPGLIDAHGSKAVFADPKAVAAITDRLPMRRHGKVGEIAAAAAFLASDASSFTTGAILPVDGGRSIHAVPRRFTALFADEQARRGTEAR